MRNLARRLRKLEAGILDSQGLIPNTPEWLDFWGDKLDKLIAGEDVDLSGITLAVTDAIIAAGEREEAAANGRATAMKIIESRLRKLEDQLGTGDSLLGIPEGLNAGHTERFLRENGAALEAHTA
jgi:hypothetical protein